MYKSVHRNVSQKVVALLKEQVITFIKASITLNALDVDEAPQFVLYELRQSIMATLT